MACGHLERLALDESSETLFSGRLIVHLQVSLAVAADLTKSLARHTGKPLPDVLCKKAAEPSGRVYR